MFLSTKNYFRFFTNTYKVYSRKSKGLSEKSIENITTSDSNSALTLIYYYPLTYAK